MGVIELVIELKIIINYSLWAMQAMNWSNPFSFIHSFHFFIA